VGKPGESYRIFAYALGPFVLCGVLLAAYNYQRFGSIGDFGEHYQLAGLNTMTKPTDQLSYLAPGLFSYLFVPARLALTFPHAFLKTAAADPFSLPAGYSGTASGGAAEPAGGLFPTMPITLLLVLLPLLWVRWKRTERATLLVCSGFAPFGFVIVIGLALALWGTTQRYEVDYATLFLIPSFVIWAALLAHRQGRKQARRLIALTGIVLTGFGAAVGTAVSFTGYYDLLRLGHPGVFSFLEDLTSPFATLATMIVGRPVIVRVAGPLAPAVSDGYTKFGEGGASVWLGADGGVVVTVDAPSSQRLALTGNVIVGPGAPPHGRLDITVQSPGQAPIVVASAAGPVALPVRLHWGLNRVNLNLAGKTTSSPYELELTDIELHSR
jgi:hypothetical protein